MMASKVFDVFISYSRKDEELALAAVDLLEKNQIRCWIDRKGIKGGSLWQEALAANLMASRVVVLVLTADSNASRYVRWEIRKADKNGIPIIPWHVRGGFEICDQLFFLEDFQGIMVPDQPQSIQLAQLLAVVTETLLPPEPSPSAQTDEHVPWTPTEPHPQPMSRYSLLGDSLILHCISEQRVVVGRDWESVDVLLLPFSNGSSHEIDMPLFERISRRLLEFVWEESGLTIHDLRSPERRTAMPALWGNSPFGGTQRLRDGSVADKTYEYLLSGVMSLQIVPQQDDARLAAVWLTLKWLCDDAWNSNQWLLLRPGCSLPVSLTDGVPTLLLTTDGVWMPADGAATEDGILNCEQRAKPVTVGQRIGCGNQSVTLSEFSTH